MRVRQGELIQTSILYHLDHALQFRHILAQIDRRCDARVVAALLRANRETLTLNALLEEDKPRARAEAEIDALAALLSSCERIEVIAEALDARRISIELAVRLASQAVGTPR